MQATPDDGLLKVRKFSGQPETNILTRKIERTLVRLYRQNESLLFNIYIYIYIVQYIPIFGNRVSILYCFVI